MTGRESTYIARYAEQAYKLCLLGAIDRELADFFGISEGTLNNWKNEFPGFLASIKSGKKEADANVAHKLYNRALGYSHPAVKIFMPAGAEEPVYADYIEHYPPDTTAGIFWLKNRDKDNWRDRREHTGADGMALIPDTATGVQRAAHAMLLMLASAEHKEPENEC